jgi:hypothetical protein
VNSTIELPWPVPDPRARRFVSEFSDMHGIVRRLQVPASIPVNTARAFITARELLRFSFYHYEFAAVAVSTSIIAIEAALRDRYGGSNLASMIGSALADGTITNQQADHLDTGRKIRNQYAHGKTMHPALPITFAADLVMTSLEVITLLLDPPATMDQASSGS